MGKYNNKVAVRLSDEELRFVDMIAEKTGDRSEAIRLAINMFKIILGLEAVDIDKVRGAFERARRLSEEA